MSPMRYYRPDFRFIYRKLKLYDMERATVRMDSSYDKITRIVERDSLNETQTASLVREHTFATSIPLPNICFEIIMGSIWPSSAERDGHQNPTTGNPSEYIDCGIGSFDATINIDTVNNTMPSPPSSAPDSSSPDATVDTDTARNATETPPEADGLSSSGSSSSGPTGGGLQPPSSSSSASVVLPNIECIFPLPTGRGLRRTQNFTELQAPGSQTIILGPPPRPDTTFDTDTTKNATEISLEADSPSTSGSSSSGPTGGGLQPPSSSSSASVVLPKIECIFPMPTGRGLRRTQNFTELQAPGSQTIILGPPPRPSLFPTYGPDAFPPLNNIPSASSGISSSGATSDTEEVASVAGVTSAENPTSDSTGTTPGITEVASASGPQPAASAQSPTSDLTGTTTSGTTEEVASASNTQSVELSSVNLKKRSRDDQDDEEEKTRPTARLHSESPFRSSLPDDTKAAPAALAPTLAPSGNGEGSSNGSPKKRSRDAEEDEEEIARPSTRTRRESPAIRSRYPSPT